MENNEILTALQDIAAQLRRIADNMEQPPGDRTTISGGRQNIGKIVANIVVLADQAQVIGRDGNNHNNCK